MINQITTDEYRKSISKYIDQASKKSDLERQENEKNKTGVFTGSFALNPISNENPYGYIRLCSFFIWDWCYKVVPAHDERDNEFAKNLILK